MTLCLEMSQFLFHICQTSITGGEGSHGFRLEAAITILLSGHAVKLLAK